MGPVVVTPESRGDLPRVPGGASEAPPRPRLVVGFCTYNRSARLPALVAALRQQACDEPFEIVAVNNNSSDDTVAVLTRLQALQGVRLHWVTEAAQGIVPARNRLLDEARVGEFLLMLDDDELPRPGWVQQGLKALRDEGLECVGGRVHVCFDPLPRPRWLEPELLGFLAEVDHGDVPRPIVDHATPVWTANVGYRMSVFADGLRFDMRYSRVGKDVGGGEDVRMFEALLAQGRRMGYRPGMEVDHFVEPWRLRRSYFLRLHFSSGLRAGLHGTEVGGRTLLGTPLYMFPQALRQAWRTLALLLTDRSRWLRQGMNFTHACGRIVGTMRRARQLRRGA
jgi:glycosyltransferase involved in cell wall biosynthesis